ncbi:MAG: hypothetical protein KDA22_00700 [Phycisphaerales bacterium]|nr:hypothetical protein [Phycisphaerales bacterium]
MRVHVMMLIWVVAAALPAGAQPSVLVVGPDEPGIILPQLIPAFADAGYVTTHMPDIADLDGADLSPYDVVWLTNGISINNPSQPARQVVPNPAGADNLAAFVGAGGGLYLPGEWAGPGQTDFAEWRDPFIGRTLGAGTVSGICGCSAGTMIYTNTNHPTGSTPNLVPVIGALSTATGAFVEIGSGRAIGWSERNGTGWVIIALWDRCTLSAAPAGRVMSLNNANNSGNYVLWAVNAVAFLAGTTIEADLDGDDTVGGADLAILLAAWGPCLDCCPEDLDDDGTIGPGDLGILLANWG